MPSDFGASSVNFKSTYKFFELMKPLDDALQNKPYITLQRNIKFFHIMKYYFRIMNILSSKADISSKQSIVSDRFVPIQQSSSSVSFDIENNTLLRHCSDILQTYNFKHQLQLQALCLKR